MHSGAGDVLPRVTKDELRAAVRAVHSYFENLASHVPAVFGHMSIFLNDAGWVTTTV
jgi:hypothetical protein